jgi:putative tryptophan/tyrosine transport system substrate-binding protein
MNRREFIAGLGGTTFACSLPARAQQPALKVPRIGWLQPTQNENVGAFIQGLRGAGYIDGQNALIETRIYGAALDQLPDLANELVLLQCDVIFAASPYAILAAMRATSTIPIVAVDLESDPITSGWAQSLARPGRQLTGLFLDLPELGGKQIELLRDAVPTFSYLAVLWDSAIGAVQFRATEAAGRAAGVTLLSLPIQHVEDVTEAFARVEREQVHAMVILSSPLLLRQRSQIADLALKARLPTISLFTSFPQSGALMAYGPNLPDMYKRAAAYVGRILKGVKLSELPIQRPTRFDLVVNLKAAKALGLTIPESFLLRADEVIE